MATIHLAGSIVLFLFGGVITLFGFVGSVSSKMLSLHSDSINWFFLFVIGVLVIVAGVFVAIKSKRK